MLRGGLAGIWGVVACALLAPAAGRISPTPTFIYTSTPRYESEAWASGGERFPEGAAILVVSAGAVRELAPGFFASADPEVSFEARNVLFAGRPRREDPWQIWEAPVEGGQPHRIAAWPENAIRPLYLPDRRIVYARQTAQGYQLEIVAMGGGQPLRLTYAPGSFLTSDVLHDGRVLYETGSELYTVYPDGSGMEAYRCDHGPARHGARQVTSGDVVFSMGRQLALFTSALAVQQAIGTPPGGEIAGPVAEVSASEWLAAWRPDRRTAYAIHRFNPLTGTEASLSEKPGVEPVLLAPREIPRCFPSGLHDWAGANVLCLNAYMSKAKIPDGSVANVRLYTRAAQSEDALLGETAVESDGSFFLHVPSEQPLRIEILDRGGRVIQAEHRWFWMRRGEQRVCVGCHAGPERAPENAVPKALLRADVPVNMAKGSR